MRIEYRFVIHSGDDIEALGVMPLEDDDEARLFGADVIRDLMGSAATRYAAYTMDVVRGRRTIARIPFAPAGWATVVARAVWYHCTWYRLSGLMDGAPPERPCALARAR
jgi:hypothetical protein